MTIKHPKCFPSAKSVNFNGSLKSTRIFTMNCTICWLIKTSVKVVKLWQCTAQTFSIVLKHLNGFMHCILAQSGCTYSLTAVIKWEISSQISVKLLLWNIFSSSFHNEVPTLVNICSSFLSHNFTSKEILSLRKREHVKNTRFTVPKESRFVLLLQRWYRCSTRYFNLVEMLFLKSMEIKIMIIFISTFVCPLNYWTVKLL